MSGKEKITYMTKNTRRLWQSAQRIWQKRPTDMTNRPSDTTNIPTKPPWIKRGDSCRCQSFTFQRVWKYSDRLEFFFFSPPLKIVEFCLTVFPVLCGKGSGVIIAAVRVVEFHSRYLRECVSKLCLLMHGSRASGEEDSGSGTNRGGEEKTCERWMDGREGRLEGGRSRQEDKPSVDKGD